MRSHSLRSLALRAGSLGALALLLVGTSLLPAQNRPDAPLQQIRPRMQAFVDSQDIAGAVTVVGRRDAILSFEAVGSQNVERNRPMTKDALFRIASMTKPITAIGIMILADEGKLSVEDPVEKHLPEFRGQMLLTEKKGTKVTLEKPSRPITIRDLLTHTSGLQPNYAEGLSDLYVKRNRSLAEGVLFISQRPLTFEPGTKWNYCNPGIDTLGRIIEAASGESYEEFLHKRVFNPLGMSDTTFYPTAEQRERLATLYDKKEGKLTAAPDALIGPGQNARFPIPAGGLYSTGADLARLYQMMLNKGTLAGKRILSPESVATMTRVQTNELQSGFTPGMGFGFGWAVVKNPTGVTEMLSPGAFGHGGAFGTQGWIDPNQDLFVILLIQRTGLPNADASAMRKDLQTLAVAAVKKP